MLPLNRPEVFIGTQEKFDEEGNLIDQRTQRFIRRLLNWCRGCGRCGLTALPPPSAGFSALRGLDLLPPTRYNTQDTSWAHSSVGMSACFTQEVTGSVPVAPTN